MACVACGGGIAPKSGICADCTVPYVRGWCVAPRQEQLEALIDAYKFGNARSAYVPLASLLDVRLPELPADVRVVPVPTVSGHVRQRGYDHMLLITKRFAKLRGLPLDTALDRRTATRQRGAGKRQRTEQAKRAFVLQGTLDPDATYLLVDDVVTTGATMKYAAKTLRDAGAQTVWVASISYQLLD